jgi:hypothetical protein
MPKNQKPKQQLMRTRIAAAAARIMAEDGVDDFAMAKRKAARQLGAGDTQSLPNNEEIETELRAYQALYQEDEQHERIRELRSQALAAMEALAEFRPYLTGSVLKGTAGRYADIDLQLFADSGKEVEIFLLNRNIAYHTEERRTDPGGQRAYPGLGRNTGAGGRLFGERRARHAQELAVRPASGSRRPGSRAGSGGG